MPNPTREELNAEIEAMQAAEAQQDNSGQQSDNQTPPADAPSVIAPIEPIAPITAQQQLPANSDNVIAPKSEQSGWFSNEESDPDKAPKEQPGDKSALVAPDASKDQSAPYWKDRASTLHGMLIKERESFQAELSQRDLLVENMKARIELLESTKGAVAHIESTAGDNKIAPDDITEEEVRSNFSDQLIADYGMDMLKAQLAIQRNDRIALRNELQQEQAQQQEQQKSEQQKHEQAVESYWRNCELIIPNAREINAEPGWESFLNEPDPVYHQPRRQLLAGASPKELMAVMSQYMKTKGRAGNTNHAGNQVMPSGRAGSGDTGTSTKPTYKASQINHYYDQRIRGKYEGTPAEAQQIEKQIHDALAENRVIFDVQLK